MSSRKKILVMDGDQSSALSVARSLHRDGYCVFTAATRSDAIARYSVASVLHLNYPDPLRNEAAFIDWVVQSQAEWDFALVIPVTERTLVPLSENRSALESVNIAMPPQSALIMALDKAQTMALARQQEVCVPRSIAVSTAEELAALEDSLDFPLVIKPTRSVHSAELARKKVDVTYARTRDSFQRKVGRLLESGPVLLQELFVGDGVGIELIANEGKIVQAFQHRRLHEVPLTGGGSSLRISESLNPVLMNATERLIRAMKWHGVAMVEFKHDAETGNYRLMEVNGRFWGSLPLAEASGINFPSMLASLLTDGQITAPGKYREGKLCRHLSKDLTWIEQVLRGARNPFSPVDPRSTLLRDCLQVFSTRHAFDVQKLNDPLPGIVDLYRISKRYGRRLKDLWDQRAFESRQRALWNDGTVLGKLREAKNILFICYGNINRSPLAGLLLEANFCSRGIPVSVMSAGFITEEDRPMDPRMLSAAERAGVELRKHSSRAINRELIEQSDVIFVMEKRHMEMLADHYAERLENTFLLGAATDDGQSAEITDPYNQAPEMYDTVFDRIARAVNAISRTYDYSFT